MPPTWGPSRFGVISLLLAALLAICLATRWPDSMSPTSDAGTPDYVPYIGAHPFDPAGYIAMAQASADESQRQFAADAALTLAPGEPVVLDLVARKYLQRQDGASALTTWARLAELSPRYQQSALESFDRVTDEAGWTKFVGNAVINRWPLLPRYVEHLCVANSAASLNRAVQVLTAIAGRQVIAASTVQCVENRLLTMQQPVRAYALHLLLHPDLPKRIDHVFNGDFEAQPNGSWFDWRFGTGGEYRDGFIVAIRSDLDAANPSRALVVRFTGRRISGAMAEQRLALEPGRYTLRYRVKAMGFADSPLPGWTLRCAGSIVSLEPSHPDAAPPAGGWSVQERAFEVPLDCAGQSLALEPATRLSALDGLRGTLSVDDVVVLRRE